MKIITLYSAFYKHSLIAIFTYSSIFSTSILANDEHHHGEKESQKKIEISIEATEITPNLYMLSGVGGFIGGNMGLSVGKDGAILIDTALSNYTQLLQDKLNSISNKPVKFLVNTHLHGDHMGNNTHFGNHGSIIIAHDHMHKDVSTKGMKGMNGWEKTPLSAIPVISYSDKVSLYLNDEPMQIIHTAAAHTSGDSIIYFTKSNVIHAGDLLFNGIFPFIDYEAGGTYPGYLAGQQAILDLANNETKIIPGHGPLANKADLSNTLAMLKDAHSIIAKLYQEGKTAEEIIASKPLAKYESYHWAFITTEKMIQQIINSLEN